MKSKTIHARIEDQTFEELEYPKKDLGMPETTQVISFASRNSPFEMLEEMGMIGTLKTPPDLSENYKDVITKSLRKKHSLGKKPNAQ
jgi:hypothetical protein